MSKRRLVMVAETLKGGLGAAVVADANQAIALGADVVVAAPLRAYDPELHTSVTKVDLDIPATAQAVRALLKARNQLRKATRSQRRADWTHVHGLRGLLLVWPQKRLILTYHGAGALPGEHAIVSVLRSTLLRVIPMLVARAYTVTPLKIRGWRPIWITAPNVLSAKPDRDYDANSFRLLWMSRVAAQKDFQMFLDLVRSCSQLADFGGAHVYGSLDPATRENLLLDSKDLNIEFYGSKNEVKSVLAGDYIFCLFSHFEGRPFALEEAISAGLPVVVSDLPGNRVLVEDARLRVSSVDEAIQAVRLLRRADSRERFGNALERDYRSARGRDQYVAANSIYAGLF
jgi:glycosyltransferase involved in cell wall biosynthesis